ncbi:hypothetical protein EDB82DRAFT_448608 [Fusarium venenatum]|uniref:uncharacterized protein n=1 Tax=Fusarium venenatum TaxID=56646 RepID=UPI001D6D28CF|nr:hypothetical protein EDB82DRAFT_448608 [Fusarium venenatum]
MPRTKTREPRVRRSCERCRQKKIKCPAEKPGCSHCRIANEICTYLPRNHVNNSHPRPIFRPLKAQQNGISPSTSAESYSREPESLTQRGDGQDVNGWHSRAGSSNSIHQQLPPITAMLSDSPSWSPANPEPPVDLLSDFVGAYRERLYFQPLPLFDPRRLQLKIGTLPHYLRWSFLALTLNFTSHNFYYGLEAKAIEYYTTSARSIVVDMAAEGLAQLEVMQTLCLLALCDHIAGKTSRAWMMVGMAAKLEALRLSHSKTDANSRHPDDAISRCHWSIAILESTFIPNCNTLSNITGAPAYPKSVSRPTPLHSSHGMKSYCADLTDAYEGNIQDVGVNATCLGYVSVWGSIISYLRDIRNGANEYPWLATSKHSQLTVKLYELENITSHRHLIRNAPFPDQPSEDLSEHREYWAPWVSFQIMMHATQAVLNNPFVQLVALRRAGRNFQPRSFLQNTVDQALFHAEWVSRLVQMCADRQFEVNDPLIGQAVAGCVSILWIFQFARDRKVSEKAKENLITCETFLGHLARKWPHIAEKLEILRTLNVKVAKQQQTPQEDESTSATIKFEPDMMWELLDPAMSGVDWANLCSAAKEKGSHATTSATIRVATKFVHPINNEVESAPVPDPEHNLFDLEDIYGEPFLDQFFSDSLLVNIS